MNFIYSTLSLLPVFPVKKFQQICPVGEEKRGKLFLGAAKTRALHSRTPTKLADVDLCCLNLYFGLYYNLDIMKTTIIIVNATFSLATLGQRSNSKKTCFFCQTPGFRLGFDFVFAKNGQSLRNRSPRQTG